MIGSWLELHAAGVPNAFSRAFGMKLRKTLTKDLVAALVISQKTGLDLDPSLLEAHGLAGGRVLEVVKAIFRLREAEAPVSVEGLLTADLKGVRPLELVEAFLRVRTRYPELVFNELVERVLDGEEVLSEVDSLVPLAHASGWGIRIEYGPLSTEEVRGLLEDLETTDGVSVRRPGGKAWESVSRATRLIRESVLGDRNGG